jgi:outer membrane receptor protein involved in Fe transport
MENRRTLFNARLVSFRAGVAVSAMLIASVASAQTAKDDKGSSSLATAPKTRPSADAPAADTPSAEVVVTGSRVIRPGISSPTPVTSVSSSELLATQPQALVAGLAQLPALSASTTSKSIGANSATGAGSFLNLRNLSPSRTLVLLDGRRVTPTNVFGYVDINMLPQSLVSDVNIVTGGASAAYGSDAVAGVVDFRLNTHFHGLKAEVTGGMAGVGDGEYYKIGLAAGTQLLDDRMHVIASFDMLSQYHAYASNRGWASNNCAIIPLPGVTTANQSATNPRQTIACDARLPYAAQGGAITSGPLTTANQGITFGPDGQPQPFNYGNLRTSSAMVGGSGVPLNQYLNFQPRQTNKVGFGRVGYDLTPDIEVFVQGSIARVRSEYPLTGPNFYTPRPFTIYSGNPYIPADLQAAMTAKGVQSFQLGIVPLQWGLVDLRSRYRNFDVTGGLQGKFGKTWHWDISYEHGHTAFDLDSHDNIKLGNIFRAADAVVDPASGKIVCRVTLTNPGTSPGCAPLNLFGVGAASQEALNYVQGDLYSGNRLTQDHVEASLRGDLLNLWAGPVSAAVGAEWRRQVGLAYTDDLSVLDSIDFTGVRGVPASVLAQSGGWQSSNPKPAYGTQSVKEAFGEVLVPLLRDLPFAHAVDFNGAVRLTDYSTSGRVVTWKTGLTWNPISDILLRATVSRDIRAPNINELYGGSNSGPATLTDPVNGGASVNVHVLASGNPDLKPERAKTFTIGGTYNSSLIRGLTLTVDYFDINIREVLGTLQAQDEINRCFAGAVDLCPLIHRDAGGVIAVVYTPQLNLTSGRIRGVDFDFGYRRSLATIKSQWDGFYSLRVVGTRLIEQSTSTPTLTGVNYVDRVGDIGQSNPKWRFNILASFDAGGTGMDLNGRYIGSGVLNSTYVAGDIDNNHVPSVFTVDMAVHTTLQTVSGKPQIFFSISNLFNKAPPIVPLNTFYTSPTNLSLYDTMGRAFAIGVKTRF